MGGWKDGSREETGKRSLGGAPGKEQKKFGKISRVGGRRAWILGSWFSSPDDPVTRMIKVYYRTAGMLTWDNVVWCGWMYVCGTTTYRAVRRRPRDGG